MDKPFSPGGPCVLVDNTARQIANINAQIGSGGCFRVRNLSGATQYFTHGATSSVTSVGAPSGGTPSANTIGMAGNGVEVFSGLLPWAIASSATGFEFIAGDGL